MEKIYFDETTFIWKTKLNLIGNKEKFLIESLEIIESMPDIKTDGFGVKKEWNNNLDFMGEIDIKTQLDKVIQIGIDKCKEIYQERNSIYNKINTESWVNVIRAKNPVQDNFYNENQKYHTHTDINKKMRSLTPNYTYVYYIQMPDIMNNDDGVLYFKSKEDKEYWIRPEEDDLIIMEGDMPHSPNDAPNSNVDRIVLAGNVGFSYIKKEKSFI